MPSSKRTSSTAPKRTSRTRARNTSSASVAHDPNVPPATKTHTYRAESGAGLASLCATYADNKKAEDIIVLDVRGIASFADFLVVCAGTSEPHLKAIANGIEESLRKDFGVRPYKSDGIPASQWIVLDYVDVVVHVFRTESRSFYGVEDLWSDADRVDWQVIAQEFAAPKK